MDRRLSLLPAEDIKTWGGLRVTSMARTAVDLARYEPHGLVVPILDGLLTRGAVDRDEMHAVLRRQVRVPHVRRARGLVDLARPGPMSPRETHTRLAIVASGLPEPDVNLEIFEDGVLRAQGDLGYWRWLIWIEYDGEEFHRQRREFGVDRSKDRWLSRRAGRSCD